MTLETVNKNIHRLTYFLGMPEDTWPTFTNGGSELTIQWSPLFFLQQYARVLDYNGCGPHGLSRIFLPAEEYQEMEEWLASSMITSFIYQNHAENKIIDNGDQKIPIVRPASLGFQFDGYYWDIQKIGKVS